MEAFHSVRCTAPIIGGSGFTIALSVDATFKGIGRIAIRELCVYRTDGGRMVREQFLHDEYAP